MVIQGFWEKLTKPIIGLAPMDGVTDAPFRFMAAKYSKPHLMITEFTSVEGICAGATKMLHAFAYDEIERPIVAQIFGSTPEAFYKSVFLICELGFDGIDINMGCPAKNVASKGSGAGLILTPKLAQKIVFETKRAAQEWADGKKIEDVGLPASILAYLEEKKRAPQFPKNIERRTLPVSIKTRIGYNEIVIEEWIKNLLETEPANISIHGRTLKQMYTGKADWEAIARAAAIIHQTQTTVLGNGDIESITEAHQKIKKYGVDGVLIGRATFGNPWIFNNNTTTTPIQNIFTKILQHFHRKKPSTSVRIDSTANFIDTMPKNQISIEQKFAAAIEHSKLYTEYFPYMPFVAMRKHLAWYCRGFENAAHLRAQLMHANSVEDVDRILNSRVT